MYYLLVGSAWHIEDTEEIHVDSKCHSGHIFIKHLLCARLCGHIVQQDGQDPVYTFYRVLYGLQSTPP